MKAVIIDDEERSAENLSLLLDRLDAGIEVAGVAHTALDGLAICDRVRPDIIFLDIQMPGSDGLELAPHLKKLCRHIVFVTAHQQYAVPALRLGAKDYLVKPVSETDLHDCLQRLPLNGDPAEQALPEKKASGGILRIPVKDGFLFIRREDLVRVEGSGSYSYLFLESGAKHLVSKSIGQMEELLGDDRNFFRCHNSHIVQLRKVERFISQEGLFVQLKDGSRAEVSRKNKDELLQLIGK